MTVDPRRNNCLAGWWGRPAECARFGVYAYLPAPTVTITAPANTYVPITGPFVNTFLEQWRLNGALDAIVYTGNCPVWTHVSYNGSFQTDTGVTVLTTAVLHNGVEILASRSIFRIFNIGAYGPAAAQAAIEIQPGDELQLVIRSDQNGAQLTAHTYSTHIRQIFCP